MSAPVIGSKEEALEESERHLSRTDEVENIPETMEERRAERLSFHLVSNEGLGYVSYDCYLNSFFASGNS